MRSTEDNAIPSPPEISILPGATEEMTVRDGTMNMFVWTDPSSGPIWKGIIPTKVKNNVTVSPEDRKVLYDGIEIPNDFKSVTNTSGPRGRNTLLILIVAMIALLVILGSWWLFTK